VLIINGSSYFQDLICHPVSLQVTSEIVKDNQPVEKRWPEPLACISGR